MRKHFCYRFRGERDGKPYKERANCATSVIELCGLIEEYRKRLPLAAE
jgi:hypothetical protein